jgi:hypothetical protein
VGEREKVPTEYPANKVAAAFEIFSTASCCRVSTASLPPPSSLLFFLFPFTPHHLPPPTSHPTWPTLSHTSRLVAPESSGSRSWTLSTLPSASSAAVQSSAPLAPRQTLPRPSTCSELVSPNNTSICSKVETPLTPPTKKQPV